jgi:hypothetical protein
VSYGPRVRAVVAYLLARQHIPNRRVAEAMADLFGVEVSTGTVDSIYAEAARRLSGFIAALVALLRSLAVLHADETTDRVGTKNCWMHVASTGLYTLIHASMTRGTKAIEQAGVLIGYQGVVIHDRLALYWKLKAKQDCAERTCFATWPMSPPWPPRPPGRPDSPRSWWRSTTPAKMPAAAD